MLGTDLVRRRIADYDDAAGVTAAFNKNVLTVLDRDLGADFDLAGFDHVAAWDRRQEWIEMRLRSRHRQQVWIAIRTEISAKFVDGMRAELRPRAWRPKSSGPTRRQLRRVARTADMSTEPARPPAAMILIAALGVVFGDFGTSPLYVMRTVFALDQGAVRPTPDDVYGVISLMFWSATVIVSIKYVTVEMRADNGGEGGVMALAALAQRHQTRQSQQVVSMPAATGLRCSW